MRKPPPAAVDLATLPKTPMSDLRRLWSAHFREPPSAQRLLLIRELAYRVQEELHGSMDAATRRLITAAMRAATTPIPPPVPAGSDDDETPARPASTSPKRLRGVSSRELSPGTRLVRVWNNRTYEVVVLGDGQGFGYQDRAFRSLTKLAREITGHHQSGPKFFGLVSYWSASTQEASS